MPFPYFIINRRSMNRDNRHKTAFEPYGGEGRCFLEGKYFA